MRQILCILTAPPDKTAQEIISAEQKQRDCCVETFDLTLSEPDYEALLDAIARADSVQVWS